MPLEDSSDAKFEIRHALFIDIVGYSKLLIHEQSELQRQLNDVVRGHGAVSSGQEIGEIDSITEGRRNYTDRVPSGHRRSHKVIASQ